MSVFPSENVAILAVLDKIFIHTHIMHTYQRAKKHDILDKKYWRRKLFHVQSRWEFYKYAQKKVVLLPSKKRVFLTFTRQTRTNKKGEERKNKNFLSSHAKSSILYAQEGKTFAVGIFRFNLIIMKRKAVL